MVSWRIYEVWQDAPWTLPQQTKSAAPAAVEDERTKVNATPPPVSPEIIISKNLFDPERGAGATREAEFNSRAFQRIRNMVLLGTVILGENRSAILQDPGTPAATPGVPAAPAGPMRIKLGDDVEGFRLTEVADRRVVFTKGASKVEVLLDYFRRNDPAPHSSSTTAGSEWTPGGCAQSSSEPAQKRSPSGSTQSESGVVTSRRNRCQESVSERW